jgi:hypothetical protein
VQASQQYRVFYELYHPDGVTNAGHGSLLVEYTPGFVGPEPYVRAQAALKLQAQQLAGQIDDFKITRVRTA